MGLLRFIGIAILIILAVRFFTRILLPWLAKYFITKAGKNMEERVRTKAQGSKIYEKGDVSIRQKDRSSNNGDDSDDGDYVDFEEVKD